MNDYDFEILSRRAENMAKPIKSSEKLDYGSSLLKFKLGKESYAIESKYVAEVVGTSNITKLPGTPDYMLGIFSVQGLIWSVIDIRDLFNIPKQGISDYPRAILVETPSLRFGILSDSELKMVYTPQILPPPDVTERIPRNFIKGTLSDYVTVILDVASMSTDPRLIIS